MTSTTRIGRCTTLILAALALCVASTAWGSEGIVRVRRITVPLTTFSDMLGADQSFDANRIFDLSIGKVLERLGPEAMRAVRFTDVMISGSRVRMVPTGEGAAPVVTLSDLDSGDIWLLSPPQKRYVLWTSADRDAARQQMEAAKKKREAAAAEKGPTPVTPELQPLGRTIELAGVTAHGYRQALKGEVTIGWVVAKPKGVLRTLYTLRRAQSNDSAYKGSLAALLDKGLVMRRQTIRGQNYLIDDIFDVKEQALDASLFVLPADFQQAPPNAALGMGALPIAPPRPAMPMPGTALKTPNP